ncbi:MAG: outer membrane protein assembly factor BamD [Bacteroidota bacterium]
MQRKKFRTKLILLLSILLISFGSCKFQKLLKSEDHELKAKKAIEYYEEERYSRTISLLDNVMPIYRGTQKSEDLNYYFAMAHYKQGDYIYAAHLFDTFHQTYPHSEHAEEFLFLSAYCKYLMSPRHSLDQTPTKEAIQQFQRFANRYPNSEKVQDANELIDELRTKLEDKAYKIAMLYYDLNNYSSAATAFQTLIVDFPNIKYKEEALFLVVKSYFLWAENSIAEKQEDRYQKVLVAHNKLIKSFPESQYKEEADKMLEQSSQVLMEIAQKQDNIE